MTDVMSFPDETDSQATEPWVIYAPRFQNLVDELDENEKREIVNEIEEGRAEDEESRSEWFDVYRECMDELTNTQSDTKDFPFQGASNAIVPIMQQAADNFADTASKAVFRGDVVSAKIEGPDQEGQKAARAERVRQHLSWQIKQGNYEDDTDAMLAALPIARTILRKTYWDVTQGRPAEYFLLPDDFVVNAGVRNLDEAPRVTEFKVHRVREIEEKIREGTWSRWDFDADTDEHNFVEQHFWHDLDDDGYPEPYCGIVHEETHTLVRLYARFSMDDVLVSDEMEVVKIRPIHAYERFQFLPALDGTFYGRGFPDTLGAINRIVNSLVRQLIDAATFQNGPPVMAFRGAGKGIKTRGRKISFQLGKVNVTDIPPEAFYTPPIPQPSVVTLQLLQAFVENAREIGGLGNMMTDVPANMPATTALAYVEQGVKPFTAQFKRLWRSLSRELKHRFDLNRRYVEDIRKEYADLNEMDAAAEDYADNINITPTSDPEEATDMQTIARANALLAFRDQGMNDQEINRRALEALKVPDIKALEPVEQGPSIPVLMMRAQLEMARAKLDAELRKMEAETALKFAQATHEIAQAEGEEDGRQLDQYLAVVREVRANTMAELDAMQGMMNEQVGMGGMEGGPGNQSLPSSTV